MMVKICSGILDQVRAAAVAAAWEVTGSWQPGNEKVRRINCKSASFQKIAKFHSLSLMLEAVGFESISDNGEVRRRRKMRSRSMSRRKTWRSSSSSRRGRGGGGGGGS